jgi:carboxypeptidase family protein/TonB-dependent receptor-like protein
MKQRFTSVLLVALLLVAHHANAQQGTTEVRGRVLDSQGAVLPGATVVVRNQDTGMFRETVSNADGTYFVSGIVPGMYLITAELSGFKKYERKDIRLEIGKTATLDVELAVGGLEETITVSAESPMVDVTSKEVGGNITGKDLVELPSINRNFIGFIGLLPGIVPSISTESFGSDSITVNGMDPRSNNYMLDGANNNDDAIGQRAGTQARTALESVQEFQVITNQFDAEFGRTTGAVINAVTKQGTNRFSGSAFGFGQDVNLTAKDYFAKERNLAKPDTHRREWGGTIGGPIVRDKAHFFFSLERVMIDRGAAIVIPSRPDLNWSPTTQDRVWNTMIRFDHQINASNTWGVRWLRELSPQRNQAIAETNPTRVPTSSAIREEDDKDQTVVGTLTSVFGNTKVNSLRLGWTQEDVAFANPCFNGNGRNQIDCAPRLSYQTYYDNQSELAQARVNNAYQVEDTLSWFIPNKRGDHDFKSGFQYEYITVDSNTQDNVNGTFSFSRNDLTFDQNNPRTYPDRLSIRLAEQDSLVKAHWVSAYVQDKWKMTNRFTLSLGLRYDVEIIPVPEEDNPFFSAGQDYPVDGNNIQPRLGLTYALDSEARSVVRGGYGRFFDKSHFDLGITNLFTSGSFTNSLSQNFPLTAIDPGPTNGQFPTDPMLAWVQTHGLTINRDYLAANFGTGRIKNTGNQTLDNPDRRVARSDQVSLGYERQIGTGLSARADYVHVWARDLLMLLDRNKGSRATTAVTSPVVRPDTTVQDKRQFVNTGETDYDALLVEANKRIGRDFSARVSYTLAYGRGNTSGNGAPLSPFQVFQDMNLNLNEGPTDFDRRHNLVVSGRTLVPYTHGMTFSWVARALSGLPFTLVNNTIDVDRNGTLFDPIAAGSYTGASTAHPEDNYTVDDFDGHRNGARGPGFFQLDTRFGWRFNLHSGRTLDLSADVFNLTNRANFANPGGDQGAASSFLVLSALRDGAAPRTLQLGARFGF